MGKLPVLMGGEAVGGSKPLENAPGPSSAQARVSEAREPCLSETWEGTTVQGTCFLGAPLPRESSVHTGLPVVQIDPPVVLLSSPFAHLPCPWVLMPPLLPLVIPALLSSWGCQEGVKLSVWAPLVCLTTAPGSTDGGTEHHGTYSAFSSSFMHPLQRALIPWKGCAEPGWDLLLCLT